MMENQNSDFKNKAEAFNYRNKEVSWLAFNDRVLQEANNPEVPVLERLHFLGIYSNNLDEFFRVRVATLKRLSSLGKKAKSFIAVNPKLILKEIQSIVIKQRKRYEKVYSDIIDDLAKENVFIINEKQLDEDQGEFVKKYFLKKVRPHLMPVMLGQTKKFPNLKDDAIYLAVSLVKRSSEKAIYSIIEIPSDVISRFLILPEKDGKKFVIMLDDIIRYGLKDIYYIYSFDDISAYTIKLTKDAELDIDDDLSEGYVSKIEQSLKQRKKGNPVRFVYDSQIPVDFLEYITRKLNFDDNDAVIPGGRYHNSKDFMNFPSISRNDLKYDPMDPIPFTQFEKHKSLFSAIKEKDCLLNFPYHSFSYFIDLLREASIDPKVTEIKITLYRLGKNSSVVNALMNAMKNGKKVTAVIELQARFDEKANIYWSNKLKDEGAKVIYGVQDLKVHSKLCLIKREERNEEKNYACVGTGNFNEDTTSVFSDHLLFTDDRRITGDVCKVFNFFEKNYMVLPYKHLIVSPFYMRKKILRMIDNEIRAKLAGNNAYIWLKLNNLVDEEIIENLYRASNVGIEVRLNIRGMFSVVPQIEDLKVDIESIGIIDRFLEHTRIFVFCNNNNPKYYISSADLMPRNLDRRVEVTCPIYDESLKRQLREFLEIQWKDNIKARVLDNNLSNNYRITDEETFRSQYKIYEYLKEKEEKII